MMVTVVIRPTPDGLAMPRSKPNIPRNNAEVVKQPKG